MDRSNIKYFIYVRKSREEVSRQIRSLEDQAADIADIVLEKKLHIVGSFEESQSAKIRGRPVFNDILHRIDAGEADGIIAWHPDRLARNAFDGGYIIDLIDQGKLRDLKFYDFWFENTSQGKMALANAFTQGKYYSDNLSDLIGRAMRRKRAQGVWPGFAPIGYLNDRNLHAIIPDPVRGPLVQAAFETYAEGTYTLEQLKRTINARGLTSRPHKKQPKCLPLSRSQYHRLLTHPIYYGLIDHGGEVCEGEHTPLITKTLFDRVQEIICGKRKPRTERVLKSYLYRRVFHCGECGCCITIETQKGHNYLRCTKKKGPCRQAFVREDAISRQVNATLSTIAVPQDAIDRMLETLAIEMKVERTTLDQDRSSLHQQLNQADQKQKRLTAAYTEGVLGLDEFREAKTIVLDQKTVLKEQLAALNKNPSYWLEPTQRFVKSLFEATLTVFGDSSPEKVQLLKKTGSNLKIHNRKIEVDFHEPWKTVEKHGRLAQQNTAPDFSGAALAGESSDVSHLAERGRFELMISLILP